MKRALLLLCALAVPGCSGGGGGNEPEDVPSGARVVNAESECAGAPAPGDVGQDPSAYPDITQALLLTTLCSSLNPGRDIRDVWPAGITREDALSYANRVCDAGFQPPPTPQEWYEQHDGPSTELDDFSAAIVNKIAEGQGSSVTRLC